MSSIFEKPHRRYNPLLEEWVLVSPHRANRPWQGQVEDAPPPTPSYEPTCFLCPGNTRSNGEVNPSYEGTYVFPNDFMALLPELDEPREGFSGAERGLESRGKGESEGRALGLWEEGGQDVRPDQSQDGVKINGLLQAQPISGECHVICFSPRHDLSLSTMSVEAIGKVIDCWAELTQALGEKYQWVQIFENRGAAMGASSPHPHGQVWTMDDVPSLVAQEDAAQIRYHCEHGRLLLSDVVAQESGGERVVVENENWLWLVPFWAVWPFEVLLLPKKPVARLCDLDLAMRRDLASILQDGLGRYDRLFGVPFPYSMGWHGAPFRHPEEHWLLHAHFYPPLLRSASVRKFMVGFELLAEAQRDITPEEAARRLREA